jgi:hypothetical protein
MDNEQKIGLGGYQPSIQQYPQLQIWFPKFSHLLPLRVGSDMDFAINN